MKRARALLVILVLCAATLGLMHYSQAANTPHVIPPPTPHPPAISIPGSGGPGAPLSLDGSLVQGKVYGADGRASYLLTLQGGAAGNSSAASRQNVSLVLVLDRSGSMGGQKLAYAKQAAMNLINSLGPGDSFGLVSYDDRVAVNFPLAPLSEENRGRAIRLVSDLRPGGSTNLGGGLAAGMELLRQGERKGAARLVLISDGLANQGVTDPRALADMARGAVRGEYGISAVGVGNDFDETLMAGIADAGAGRYYYLADAGRFSETFMAELSGVRTVVAQGVAVKVPLKDGLALADAGGYPVSEKGNTAVFYPGDISAGESRTIRLTFAYPASGPAEIAIPAVYADYTAGGKERRASCASGITLARAEDEKEALASVDRESWEKSVISGEYGKLQEEVADDIREGNKDRAMERIDAYYGFTATSNSAVGSAAVASHLENDVDELKKKVEATFAAKPACAAEARKQSAKELQSRGYNSQKGFGSW